MKTIFLLSALAVATLAAPSPLNPGLGPIGDELPEAIKREKKSPTLGKIGHGGGYVPVAVVPVQQGIVAVQPGLHYGPNFGHHHSPHQPHYFREADVNEQPLETRATITTRSAEIEEGKSDMEKNLVFAKAAVEDLERDMLKIEGNQHARMQWKNADIKSDIVLHDNIQKAKEALEFARKSFIDLESTDRAAPSQSDSPQQPSAAGVMQQPAAGAMQPLLKPVSHEMKPAERQRLAQWKENIDSINTNGPAEERDLVFQTKNAPDMNISPSTNIELFSKMDNKWQNNVHSTDMKSADGTGKIPLRFSNPEPAIRAAPVQDASAMFTPANHRVAPMAVAHERQPDHEQRMSQLNENIDALNTNARAIEMKNANDVGSAAFANHEALPKMDSKWHHDLQNMKSVDAFPPLLTPVDHERASNVKNIDSEKKHLMKSANEHDAARPKENIQTTELRSLPDSDDQFKNQQQQAKNLRDEQHKLSASSMKAAESTQHSMRPTQTLKVPQRHDLENLHQAEWNQNYHLNQFNKPSGQNTGSFNAHASAKSSDNLNMAHHDMNQEHARASDVDFMRKAMAEQQWKNMHQSASARSYGGGYGSVNLGGGSAGAIISGGAGAGSAGGAAVGVFPNARVGGCSLPLLLSCSPSVVAGSLAHAARAPAPVAVAHAPVEIATSYGAPAVGAALYSPASAYRSEDHLNTNKKRDTNKLNKVKQTKKAYGPVLQKTQIIQSVQ